jgi:hypothetical protein
MGEQCSSGCRTKDHRSYADCLQDKGVKTYLAAPSKGLDGTTQKRWDSELSSYREARSQGIQPDGTTRRHIEKAVRLSDMRGMAYGRDFNIATPVDG